MMTTHHLRVVDLFIAADTHKHGSVSRRQFIQMLLRFDLGFTREQVRSHSPTANRGWRLAASEHL
jgi:hypothetical protein